MKNKPKKNYCQVGIKFSEGAKKILRLANSKLLTSSRVDQWSIFAFLYKFTDRNYIRFGRICSKMVEWFDKQPEIFCRGFGGLRVKENLSKKQKQNEIQHYVKHFTEKFETVDGMNILMLNWLSFFPLFFLSIYLSLWWFDCVPLIAFILLIQPIPMCYKLYKIIKS